MPIPFKDETDLKGLKQAPYNLTRRDRRAIDEVLDPLVKQGRVQKVPLGKPSAAASPAFVVWKNGKPRVVVDLRRVNTKLYPDAYPLPKQDEVLEAMGGGMVFTSMDVTKGFFQQAIRPEDRWKTAFVTPHRGQEQLNVATMGLANSPGFSQHRMETLLAPYLWKFALVYVDDIIVFSKSLEKHLDELERILSLLEASGVTLALSKCHFAYPSVDALGHHVSRLGLSTAASKTEAVRQMDYPKSLSQLEIGLGFFGYYRKFVPYYSHIAQPLIDLKTRGYKDSPAKKPAQKHFGDSKGFEDGTSSEMPQECKHAWDQLKEKLCNAPTLAYPDFDKGFILYCDGSHERGFGAALHQEDHEGTEKPILYISKALLPHEKNYWATELEVAALVWALQKLRHYLDSGAMTVYTDHSAITGIFKNEGHGRRSNRLNNWQLFLSKYTDQMNIIHRPGKSHNNADGLSRLETTTTTKALPVEPQEVHTLMELDSGLRKAIVNALPNDKHLGKIYGAIQKRIKSASGNPAEDTVTTTLHSFRIDRGTKLLHFQGQDGKERLCLPAKFHKMILRFAHDQAGHVGKTKTYDRIRQSIYVPRMKHLVDEYVLGCPVCRVSKPGHHPPYGELQPIQSADIPFSTLSMDFVVDLPESRQKNTVLLTITDKFTKFVRLIAGKKTDNAPTWAERFFNTIYKDWGAPRTIISDRDSKFTSTFWRSLFHRAKIHLAMSSAYHPATDGQSERTNQTVETMLRCILVGHGEFEWETYLPEVEFAINTTKSEATGETPFRLLYGVEARSGFSTDNTDNQEAEDFVERRRQTREDAADALAMAKARMSYYFDRKHTPITMPDKVYLRLVRGAKGGYRVPSTTSMSPIRAGPFRVIRRVGRLAYELELPEYIKIHPVISVIHLEPAPEDPYARPQPKPGPIRVGEEEHYEVEKVVDHEMRGRSLYYRIKWKGHPSEEDTWEPGTYIRKRIPRLVKAYEQSLLNR